LLVQHAEGLDTDTICVSLGSKNNPSDSVLSVCAKRTEGGWEAESKRAVGGGCVWGNQKKRRSTDASRRRGKELLARREKTVKHIKAVYMILNIYMEGSSRGANMIKEVTLSR